MTTTYHVEYKVFISKTGTYIKRGRWIPIYLGQSKPDCESYLAGLHCGPKIASIYYRIRGIRSPKPQAPVAAHESDKQVPAPTAPRRLPMQRVLVSPFHVLRTLFGEPVTRSIRPAFARLHPSWAPVSAGWPVAVSGSQMRLPLGATKKTSPVLERDLQRQKRALRADLRAIRTGVAA